MPKKQSTGLRLSQGKVEVVNKNEDSPLPSSEELYRLYEFRPDLVDVAVNESVKEMEHRRNYIEKQQQIIKTERLQTLVAVCFIVLMAFSASIYLAITGHDAVASVLVGGTLASIIAAIVRSRS